MDNAEEATSMLTDVLWRIIAHPFIPSESLHSDFLSAKVAGRLRKTSSAIQRPRDRGAFPG
jgi:hypothetical protein